jgi:hypothetical protein
VILGDQRLAVIERRLFAAWSFVEMADTRKALAEVDFVLVALGEEVHGSLALESVQPPIENLRSAEPAMKPTKDGRANQRCSLCFKLGHNRTACPDEIMRYHSWGQRRCTDCGVGPGEACRGMNDTVRPGPHLVRTNAAA